MAKSRNPDGGDRPRRPARGDPIRDMIGVPDPSLAYLNQVAGRLWPAIVLAVSVVLLLYFLYGA